MKISPMSQLSTLPMSRPVDFVAGDVPFCRRMATWPLRNGLLEYQYTIDLGYDTFSKGL